MGPVVKVLQGALEGSEGRDLEGNVFFKFLGVPYAKPPIGDLRFKEPQPADSWTGVREATQECDPCYQLDMFFTRQFGGSEDCLYLNVFTRELPTDGFNLKPVMVWIHGGGLTSGSNSLKLYGPEFLVSEDVVLVTINYRLGLLGFLRLKDPELNISGNMGFKDQVEALRWVKSNIRQFNGDPDNVTIFGESAGGESAHLHVLSPLSRDLFHKAILQSGTGLNLWCDECDHDAVQVAQLRDPSVSTEKEALEVLKSLSVQELYQLQVDFIASMEPNNTALIGLVIEPASKKTAFLSKRSIHVITSGEYNKVPMIFGYTNREGILFNEMRKLKEGTAEVTIDNFIPEKVNLRKNDTLRSNYVEKLKNLYFSGSDQDDNVALLMTDSYFLTGTIGSVKHHAQSSAFPVYLYKLSLDTQLNTIKAIMKISNVSGCSHGDDLGYLFKTFVTPPIEKGSIEDTSLRRIVRLWTNFAKFGNPTPDEAEFGLTWKPVTPSHLNTLHINEDLQIEENPEGKRMDLWKQIYQHDTATMKYL